MQIRQALPTPKYVAALERSQSPEWQRMKAIAIQNVQRWASHSKISRKDPPAVWFGYGKDSQAVLLLLKEAGVNFTALTIDNGGDIPAHWLVMPEWDRYFGKMNQIVYKTEKRYVEILAETIEWGQMNDVLTKEGKLVNFWDFAPLFDQFSYEVSDQFWGEYGASEQLFFSGKRAAEAMDRYYLFDKRGPFHRNTIEAKIQGHHFEYAYWCGYPLANWKDLDVWALLVSANVPVSPIYSYHAIPQKGGKHAYPRTYWYANPILMNGYFYRWLARYAPVQLKEMLDLFPEIDTQLRQHSRKE